MNKLNLTLMCGTTRKEAYTYRVCDYIEKVISNNETCNNLFNVAKVSPTDFNLLLDGNRDQRYSDIASNSDAFLIVTPEYNHSFPGSLKGLLDAEMQAYKHKPVAFASVSAGPWGGTRVIESLLPVVRELGLVASSVSVMFPNVKSLFLENGEITDNSYEENVCKMLLELHWLAVALKNARDNT